MTHRQLILSSVRHDMHFHQFAQRIRKRLHIHARASILSGHGRDVVKNFQLFFDYYLTTPFSRNSAKLVRMTEAT